MSKLTRLGLILVLIGLSFGMPPTSTAIETASQLKNVNTQAQNDFFGIGRSSGSDTFAVVGNRAFFVFTDAANGSELWVTDGTANSTDPVRDIRIGTASSNPSNLTAAGNKLFFLADYQETVLLSSQTLWVSDGTPTGTSLVIPTSTNTPLSGVQNMAASGSRLFFSTPGAPFTNEKNIWVTDGTSVGTTSLMSTTKNIVPLATVGTTFYFGLDDPFQNTSSELWKSDGTSTGTVKVKTLVASGAAFATIQGSKAAVIGSTLYFLANDGSQFALWQSNGTDGGTTTITSLFSPNQLLAIGSKLFFQAGVTSFSDPALWSSDGTAISTQPVANTTGSSGSGPRELTHIAGKLYFIKADGMVATLDPSTLSIVDLNVTNASIANIAADFVEVGGTIFFVATNNGFDYELWKTNGTSAGTSLVRNISDIASSVPNGLINLDNTLFFTTNSKPTLWTSDGTNAGTVVVVDLLQIEKGLTDTSLTPAYRSQITQVGTTTFFVANDTTNGRELWKSDGTTTGTVLVSDIQVGTPSSNPNYLTNWNNQLFFTANDGRGDALWVSDGTNTGTAPVKIFGTTTSVGKLIDYQSKLFFFVSTTTSGPFFPNTTVALWRSDGTAGGTTLVKQLGTASELTLSNNTLFFANNGQLWKSDGTEAGTVQVSNIDAPLVGGLNPRNIVSIGSTLYFFGTSTNAGLWKSDGTEAGTVPIKSLGSPFSSSLFSLTATETKLFFNAPISVNSSDQELWVSDGTEAGTRVVKDINATPASSFTPDTVSSSPVPLVSIGDSILFSADDGVHGRELWISDGTEAGTTLLKDFTPGPASGMQRETPIIEGNAIYLAAASPENGLEIWTTDGSTTGTVIYTDIAAGARSSSPQDFATISGKLYFRADENITGQEIWSVNDPTPDPRPYKASLPLVITP